MLVKIKVICLGDITLTATYYNILMCAIHSLGCNITVNIYKQMSSQAEDIRIFTSNQNLNLLRVSLMKAHLLSVILFQN